jgi:hypothetical protein
VKLIRLGNLEFSKLICGTNAFYARSHFSAARDAEYRGRFTESAIEKTLQRCLELGVNAVESSANERIVDIIGRLRAATGRTLHLVGSTRIDETSQMKSHRQKLSFLVERKAELCIIHAQIADTRRQGERIPGLKEFIEEIHTAGLLAGISAHRVATVELCEKNAYGIDAYLFPLNMTGFVYPGYAGTESVQQRVDLVRGIAKPFILMKTLAAGRIPPEEGLHFIAENSKGNDLISLGLGSQEELEESASIIGKYFPD